MLETDRFIVQVVLRERDAKGEVVRELPADPVVLFSHQKLAKWAQDFPRHLDELNASAVAEANGAAVEKKVAKRR